MADLEAGSVSVKFDADTSGLNRGINDAMAGLKGLSASMALAGCACRCLAS